MLVGLPVQLGILQQFVSKHFVFVFLFFERVLVGVVDLFHLVLLVFGFRVVFLVVEVIVLKHTLLEYRLDVVVRKFGYIGQYFV